MEILALKMLYGTEFWDELKHQVRRARERILIAPAFIHEEIYKELLSTSSKEVNVFFLTRDDNEFKPEGSLIVPRRWYHAKIFVIDNNLILGSHNLIPTSIEREGECSIQITTEYETISQLLFEILFKIFVENSGTNLKFIDKNIAYLYWDDCPFCGENLSDPLSIRECPGYGGYVSESDCESYGENGYCKYCVEPKVVNREILFCDDRGCGLGVDTGNWEFVFHGINPPSEEYLKNVWRIIQLFNGISQVADPKQSNQFLHEMDLLGNAYLLSAAVGPSYLVDVNILKSSISRLIKEFEEDLKKTETRAKAFVDQLRERIESITQKQLEESRHKKEKQEDNTNETK